MKIIPNNPVDYVKSQFQQMGNALNKANSNGIDQAKSDITNTKAVITTSLTTGTSAALAKPKTPQQAGLFIAGAAIGVGISASVGYVDGFGKSLGFWD